jgi:hypothetical protein
MNRPGLEERISVVMKFLGERFFCYKTPSVVANAPEGDHILWLFLGPCAPGRRSLPGVETGVRCLEVTSGLTCAPGFPAPICSDNHTPVHRKLLIGLSVNGSIRLHCR